MEKQTAEEYIRAYIQKFRNQSKQVEVEDEETKARILNKLEGLWFSPMTPEKIEAYQIWRDDPSRTIMEDVYGPITKTK